MNIGWEILLVGTGGFFGAMSRFSISKLLNKNAISIPTGTIIANLLGALLLGVITGANANAIIGLLFGIGFLGAFTTFSTFKLEILNLQMNRLRKQFILYILMTYGFGLILAFIGYELGSFFFT